MLLWNICQVFFVVIGEVTTQCHPQVLDTRMSQEPFDHATKKINSTPHGSTRRLFAHCIIRIQARTASQLRSNMSCTPVPSCTSTSPPLKKKQTAQTTNGLSSHTEFHLIFSASMQDNRASRKRLPCEQAYR